MWKNESANAFLSRAAQAGSVLGLENIYNLMKELGNIQDELAVIHIAGTNGKGSTGAMLEEILKTAGYSVGRYSSPAVFSEEEKYQINGMPIDREEFLSELEQVAFACGRMVEKGLTHPTLFEIETAVAFLWFYHRKCQVVILETGLGGTMDATNIIRKPLCSVITSVSMDHMAFLGDTLAEIAGEKAGIIKKGCPVVTIKQNSEAARVIETISKEKQARLMVADSDKITNVHYGSDKLIFDWEKFQEIRLSLIGMYQPENAVLAMETIRCLNQNGFSVSEEAMRRGLENVSWPARFEVVCKKPFIVIDGAHNEDAAKKLRKTLEMGFTNGKIIYIIGVLADKEYEKILKCMLPLAEYVFTVTPDNPRALSGEVLCDVARKYHEKVVFEGDLPSTLKRAWQLAKEDSEAMILAFGSLSYLGSLKEEINKMIQEEMNHGR